MYTAVVAVNNQYVFEKNFLQSRSVKSGELSVSVQENSISIPIAYNKGIKQSSSSYLLFAHQDVYIPANFFSYIQKTINYLEKHDPRWAVLGVIGKSIKGDIVGNVWDSGLSRVVGTSLTAPIQVQSIDELLIVLKRESGILFDESLPGFHLYGTDIVQIASIHNYTSYVADAPVIHNSLPVLRLDYNFVECYQYMQRKWKTILPIQTLIVPITVYGWALKKHRLRRCFMKNNRRYYRRLESPSAKAYELGYE